MKNTSSRLETRLAQLLATTPPVAARHTAEHRKVDLVYLSPADQERLNNSLRE